MRQIVRPLVLCLTLLATWSSRPTLADVVGTSDALIFDLQFGGYSIPLTGEVTYTDMVRTVFGVPVNLGSAGMLDLSGLVTVLPPLYNSGTWTTRAVGAQCASCDSSCNGCGPACSLCWAMSGTFTCSTCDPDAPAAGSTTLISTVTLTGSIVAGLRASRTRSMAVQSAAPATTETSTTTGSTRSCSTPSRRGAPTQGAIKRCRSTPRS